MKETLREQRARAARAKEMHPAVRLVQSLRGSGRGHARKCASYLHLSQLELFRSDALHDRFAVIRVLQKFLSLQTNDLDFEPFFLTNNDMVLVGPADLWSQWERLIEQVRRLCGGDGGRRLNISSYHLGDEIGRSELIAAVLSNDSLKPEDLVAPPLASVTPETAQEMESGISRVRITDVLRRRMVASLGGGGVKPVFEAISIDRSELLRRYFPGIPDRPGHPLARHLMASLDHRVLDALAAERRSARPSSVSVKLAPGTAATYDFSRLVGRDRTPGSLRVEFDIVEILADANSYEKAASNLAAHGIPIIVNGVRTDDLGRVDPVPLEAAMVEIEWNKEASEPVQPELISTVRALVGRAGALRVVMADVDTEAAMTCALSCGIRQLRGSIVDRLFSAKGIRS